MGQAEASKAGGAGGARMFRRLLLLGHTGFIGSHLVRFFRAHAPHVEVVGRSLSAIDLTNQRDVELLAELCGPDTAVLMCAAIKRQFGDNLDTFSQNVMMVMNLCRLLQSRPVGRLVFFSSAAVYGEEIHNPRITEQTPVHPASFYGMAKYTSECLFRKIFKVHRDAVGSSLLIVRPALIYGPGDSGGTYGPSGFVRSALKREPIILWGDGTERREFLFIDDVVQAVSRLTFHDYDGVVNLVSGTSNTFRDAVDAVARLAGSELRVTSRPRTKDKVDNGFSNEMFRSLVPDLVFTSLEEGTRRTFEAEAHALLRQEHVLAGGRA